MPLSAVVLRGMSVLRRVTTAHVPANQAETKMHPAVAHLDALLADMRVGAGDFDLVEMRTFSNHGGLQFVRPRIEVAEKRSSCSKTCIRARLYRLRKNSNLN